MRSSNKRESSCPLGGLNILSRSHTRIPGSRDNLLGYRERLQGTKISYEPALSLGRRSLPNRFEEPLPCLRVIGGANRILRQPPRGAASNSYSSTKSPFNEQSHFGYYAGTGSTTNPSWAASCGPYGS